MHFRILSTQNTNSISIVLPVLAIIVSIISIWLSTRFSRKSLRLAIQQMILKTVGERVSACNTIWREDIEALTAVGVIPHPHFAVISEIIISMEVIEGSFKIFQKNYKSVRENEKDYYFLFWKQMRTDLRGFIKDEAPRIATRINNQYYTQQINDILSAFDKAFEPVL
jgi:hypothetical protein